MIYYFNGAFEPTATFSKALGIWRLRETDPTKEVAK